MKTKLIMVSSVDGKSTNWKDQTVSEWASTEDQEYFSRLIKDSQLIIMGSKTYQSIKEKMKSKEGRLRIVLTSKPDEFQDEQETGILEFSSHSTKDLVKELEARGYTEALLVGGEEVNGDFLKNDMIDELWLTLEPNIFGSGKGLFKGEFDKELELFEMNRMNVKGTILLKYKVL